MQRARILIYEGFQSTKTGFRFFYRVDQKEYSFWISTDKTRIRIDEESKKLVLGHIGLTFLIDIAAICCPHKISIKALFLSEEQLDLWKWVYQEASLEGAYNGKTELLFRDTVWEVDHRDDFARMFSKNRLLENVTVAMSGGKESLTALNLFKGYPQLSLLFFDYSDKNSFHMRKVYARLRGEFENHQVNTNISHTGRLSQKYGDRDCSMFVIGQLIFNSLLFSDRIDYLAIGNEYSANFGNASYKGMTVNHQYDKTIEFAERINAYLQKYFNGVITYFSPFFGLYEYRIAELFFIDNDYLDVWTSCNNSNSKHNFCCRCSKCAFIYMICLPYVTKNELDKYFFKSPLDDLKLCRPLIDIHAEKPTNCVGEKKECYVALNKIMKQGKADDSEVIRYFQKEILPQIAPDLETMEEEVTTEQSGFKYFPKELLKKMPPYFFVEEKVANLPAAHDTAPPELPS